MTAETAEAVFLLVELLKRSVRVLDLHHPCHVDGATSCDLYGNVEVFASSHLVFGPVRPVCTHCTYDDRNVTYPCPTVAAIRGERNLP